MTTASDYIGPHGTTSDLDVGVDAVKKCDPTCGYSDPKSTMVDLMTLDLT